MAKNTPIKQKPFQLPLLISKFEIDVPIYKTRVVGNRLEIYLYGGKVITTSIPKEMEAIQDEANKGVQDFLQVVNEAIEEVAVEMEIRKPKKVKPTTPETQPPIPKPTRKKKP